MPFQSALISAFQRRNFDAFKYALEHLRADPNIIDHRLDMSIFEKILMTPNSSDFISLCIDNGADLYQVNSCKASDNNCSYILCSRKMHVVDTRSIMQLTRAVPTT